AVRARPVASDESQQLLRTHQGRGVGDPHPKQSEHHRSCRRTSRAKGICEEAQSAKRKRTTATVTGSQKRDRCASEVKSQYRERMAAPSRQRDAEGTQAMRQASNAAGKI